MKFIWVCAALMAMFVTGECLTCNTCRVGVAGKCPYSSTKNCIDSEPNCYKGELVFNISRFVTLQTRGCIASSFCNQTQSGALLTAGYTVSRTCCSTDRCNGATSIQLPLTAALSAALLAVCFTWSL
ncbi:protein Bouncer-like [Anarrhichthys ocellatus]|uniref:protein Bouncer-like n=1 Tax=Anarrhichthys ocellatus TaxID=433405 RepID=UPI0012EE657E|nr:protein Bouncer-like [Anarrhichthys ocellatus]